MPSHAYLAASPVWDANLQRQKLVAYAYDQVCPVGDRELGLIAEPMITSDAELGRLQSVRLQWLDHGPMDAGLQAEVSIGGEAVRTRTRPVGESGLRLLVPAVAEPRKLEIELTGIGARFDIVLQPQRQWEIHLIHHSHLDIGYTDPQAIVREQHQGYLDDVLRLIRQTDDRQDAELFRWSEEALFAATDWLANRPAKLREEFIERVRQGRISLSAMPFNLHTEMCSTDELYELLRPARDLQQRYGLRFRSAMQTDVPGAVVGLPDALSSLGVEYLSVAHNWAGRSDPDGVGGAIDLPRLFRWRGPQGGEVLVWRTDTPHGLAYMEGPTVGFHESYEKTVELFPAYLSSLAKRPYPLSPGSVFGWLDTEEQRARSPYPWDILHLRVHGSWSDNAGPSRTISDVVRDWNAEWEFPKLRLSTNEDFFDAAVQRIGDQLQTFTGDWNDWWAHGVGAAAAPVSVGRKAQNELADAQTLSALYALRQAQGATEQAQGATGQAQGATEQAQGATGQAQGATGQAQGATGQAQGAVGSDQAAAERVVDPVRGYEQLALWDEHTWGASNSWDHSDQGSSAGEHQWYWKVARAYEALDEAERGLHLAGSALAQDLAPAAEQSVYVINTAGQPRTETVDIFLPAGVIALDRSVTVTDARSGEEIPYDERIEEQRSRGLGRHLRVTVRDVPPVGLVRLDLTTGALDEPLRRRAAAARGELAFENAVGETEEAVPIDPADELVLENDHLRVELDQRDGTIGSMIDKRTGRQLINTEAALGFNAYVYDHYATIGHSNHNSSKFADSGNGALLSSREIGGPVAVADAGTGAVDSWLQVTSAVPGAEKLITTYRLRHDRAQLDIVNRLSKPAVIDKESAFFAFPFAAEDPVVLQESAGGLSGPNADRVPGGAQYLTAIRHWISVADRAGDGPAIGWATGDVPLVQTGHIALPYVPFTNTMGVDEPATIYSWVHNNIWDTNFPVEQEFEMDFRYTVLIEAGEPTAVAARAADSIARPLHPVIAEGAGEAAESLSVLEIADPRVRLVGLTETEDGAVVARLFCTDPEGASTAIRLPDGVRAAHRGSYWGDRLEELSITDGQIQLVLPAAGAAAVVIDRDA